MIAAAGERRDCAEARLITGGEDERRFLVEELRESRFQLIVEVERAVEKATAGGSAAVAVHRFRRCREHLGVMSEAEVIVRADHDLPLTADARFGRGGFLDRLEVRIDAAGSSLLGQRVSVGL